MNKTIERIYRKIRKFGTGQSGRDAQMSLRSALVVCQWRKLEDAGLVRLIAEDEADPDLSYLDTWDHLSERTKRNMIDRYYQLGIVCVIGQYRTSEDAGWKIGDSVGNCIGYENPLSYTDNSYVVDIMAQTISELRDALKSRCPLCGK